jgi:hypothetical protein
MIEAELVYNESFTARNFNTSTLTISGLDGDVYDYECIIFLGTGTSDTDFHINFNSDTASNYRRYYMRGVTSTALASTADSESEISLTRGTRTADVSFIKFTVTGSSGDERYVSSLHGSNSNGVAKTSGYWKNTADSISSIDLSAAVSTVTDAHIMLYRTPKASEQSNWELIKTEAFTSLDLLNNPIDLTGIDGDTDIKYKMTIDSDVNNLFYIRLNNDSGSNYKNQWLYNNSGAITALNTTDTYIYGGNTFNQIEYLINAETGAERLVSSVHTGAGVSGVDQNELTTWYTNTATNLTSIRFSSLAATLATGTAKLYRKIEPSETGDTLPFEVIETVDISGDFSAGHTFSNLLGDSVNLYKLEFLGSGIGNLSTQINADTSSNYTRQYLRASTSTVSAAAATSTSMIIATASSTQAAIELYLYPRSGENRPILSQFSSNENRKEFDGFWWGNSADEITSLKVFNSSTNVVTGKLILSRLVGTPPIQSFAMSTAQLNGTTQWFDSGNPSELQITGDFTASIWVKFDTVAATSQVFFSKFNSASNQRAWQMYYTGGDEVMRCSIYGSGVSPADAISVTAFKPIVGTWYNVVLQNDGSDAFMYVNGALEEQAAHTAGIYDTSADVIVGARQDASTLPTDGSLALPMIWDRVLTPAELVVLYNLGIPNCHSIMPAGLKTDLQYAPPIGNWDSSTGDELIDESGNGIITTNIASTPFTGTGLNIKCF